MTSDSNPIVFSTGGFHRQVCPTCDQHPCVCPEMVDVIPVNTQLRLRLDKKGRRGKAVTVVFDLPPNPDYFNQLVKKLKAHCGTGGVLKDDRMEIQGDQRDRVQAYLEKMGFRVSRAGG